MSALAIALFVSTLFAAAAVPERPLEQIPYTPSLDVPSMDRTADACVDFYQFACGGWIASNPIPPDQASWSVYGKLTELNNQFLWGVLEDAARPSPDRTPAQQKIGDYFQACMDESTIESLGAKPLQPLLDQDRRAREQAPARGAPGRRARALLRHGLALRFLDPIRITATQTQVIAYADAGGLGCRIATYLTKNDKKSKELRASDRHVHVLAGRSSFDSCPFWCSSRDPAGQEAAGVGKIGDHLGCVAVIPDRIKPEEPGAAVGALVLAGQERREAGACSRARRSDRGAVQRLRASDSIVDSSMHA